MSDLEDMCRSLQRVDTSMLEYSHGLREIADSAVALGHLCHHLAYEDQANAGLLQAMAYSASMAADQCQRASASLWHASVTGEKYVQWAVGGGSTSHRGASTSPTEPKATDDDLYEVVGYRIDESYRGTDDHIDEVKRVVLDDGSLAWLKPASGEADSGRIGIAPGQGARRNMASYEIDKALGLGVTPRIRLVMTDTGEATIQDHAPGIGRYPWVYDIVAAQRLAVLDYVSGQTDRHEDNYGTNDSGGPAAFDNGLCLSSSTADPIRSDFVASFLHNPLDASTVKLAKTADRVALRIALRRLSIPDEVVTGVIARLDEVASGGCISGESWPGKLQTANRMTVI